MPEPIYVEELHRVGRFKSLSNSHERRKIATSTYTQPASDTRIIPESGIEMGSRRTWDLFSRVQCGSLTGFMGPSLDVFPYPSVDTIDVEAWLHSSRCYFTGRVGGACNLDRLFYYYSWNRCCASHHFAHTLFMLRHSLEALSWILLGEWLSPQLSTTSSFVPERVRYILRCINH